MKSEALNLRKQGYSLGEISLALGISKSTASLWLRGVSLGDEAVTRLKMREAKGRSHAHEVQKNKSAAEEKILRNTLIKEIEIIKSPFIARVLVSLLIWTEGTKSKQSYLTFVNSDPSMVSTYIYCLKLGFNASPDRFRALLHVHQYHDEALLKEYWSSITGIDVSQFNKSYRKANSGITIKDDYKGCISIRYYDARVAREVRMIYNVLPTLFS